MVRNKLSISEVWNYSDPREVPAYSVSEAAHYLIMPQSTISAWLAGTSYGSLSGEIKRFRNVIDLPKKGGNLLSFFNLVGIHALRSLRTRGIQLPAIRKALDFVKTRFHWKRALIQEGFKTSGVSLFVEHLGSIVDVAADGQLVIKEVMTHLGRIEWEDSVAVRLYPFTRRNIENAPMSVFIDPRFSFGRPLLKNSHIATSVIAERYKGGESIEDLALDYGCSRLEIEEGVRCELRLEAAA